jgi:hypothetical protein
MSVKEFEESYPSAAKRAIIVQGYAFEILSKDENEFYFSGRTKENQPVFVTRNGVYVVTPAKSLDDFTHVFTPSDELATSVEANTVVISKDFDEVVTLEFSNNEEAIASSEELDYLLGEKWH